MARCLPTECRCVEGFIVCFQRREAMTQTSRVIQVCFAWFLGAACDGPQLQLVVVGGRLEVCAFRRLAPARF